MINPKDFYLDLNELTKLDRADINNINTYYRDMLSHYCENRLILAESFFNTLVKSGYLKNYLVENRNDKLENLI